MSRELWPARLHHLRRDSPKPEPLARFYGELLGDPVGPLADVAAGRWPRPALVVAQAPRHGAYFAFEQDAAHLEAYWRRLPPGFHRRCRKADLLYDPAAGALPSA
jgi:hypothetical protein